MNTTAVYGRSMKPAGVTPAVALINPRFPHNVGAALRAASCYGLKQIWYSGDRVKLDPEKGERLPREERMKGFKDVELRQFDHIFDQFPGATPVAVEVRDNSENLVFFEHPENPLYVFGPEDGSLPAKVLQHCHRFVMIPTMHCTNLAAAVNTVLYDRLCKRVHAGLEAPTTAWEMLNAAEHRGYWDSNPTELGLR